MILISFGTRPEYIKLKSTIEHLSKLGVDFKTVFTGQHVDLLKDIEVDFRLEIKDLSDNRLNNVMFSPALNNLPWGEVKLTLVHGDTTSALGMALCSFNHNVPVAHVEAGLRTYDYDNPFPEELNRQLISRIATIHFAPTQRNKETLENELVHQIKGRKIFVTGNTGLDHLHPWKLIKHSEDLVLVTMHRRENHHNMDEWFKEINRLAGKSDLEWVIPLHPNPNVQKHKHLLTNLNVIDPVSHQELLDLMVRTKAIITDSGGIQEEATFLNKKYVVCRKKTERPEGLGEWGSMAKEPAFLEGNFKFLEELEIVRDCPFGDGHSGEKIAKHIYEFIK